MSSHHIVREKQEPALLVLGLNDFPDELLGQLLEWSPTVITTPDTAEKLHSYGIKIDWIITNSENEVQQSDVKLMSAGKGNLTDAALKYLSDNGYPAVNIITDELNLNDFEPFADRINLVIFHHLQKIYPVNPGFRKWKPAGEIVEIKKSENITAMYGLEEIQSHRYRTIADGFFSLDFPDPFLFIAEEI